MELDYPTRETQTIAQMLDFSLRQASVALAVQNTIACAVQLSAAAAYAGTLSVLLANHPLGIHNGLIAKSPLQDMVMCANETTYTVTPN